MIRFIPTFVLPLIALMLASCSGDVMEVMMENKSQPVGVLMRKPNPPQVLTQSQLSFVNGVTAGPIDYDAALSERIGHYDNNVKTFRKYGRSVVAKLRAQGINAYLLDSYPSQPVPPLSPTNEEMEKFKVEFRKYPAETKKYPRFLIIGERATITGYSGSPDRFKAARFAYIEVELIDSVTNEILGTGFTYDINFPRTFTSQAAFHSAMDEVLEGVRKKALDETFYNYEE